jgi:uncharacterized protein YgiB involved in biofilm formation
MTHPRPIAVMIGATLALGGIPAIAQAQGQNYPPPENPSTKSTKPKGPFKTLRVGKKLKYKTIQSAVNAAKPGDTVKVTRGTYKESVKVSGSAKRFIKIIGDVDDPQNVVLEGSNKLSNGVQISSANGVTLRGLKARRYKANGFFAVNVSGYVMDRLIAELPGTYGLYAFNSTGGSMTNSLSYKAADGSYYVGQTPEQSKPVRTIIRNVVGWGSVLGYSGTNSRYVTITNSKFFNNAVGLAPNTLDSEKFPPNEDNVFTNNDVFWNNFDVYRGKPPFKSNRGDDFVYPPGTGFFLLSGRNNLINQNRIYGNQLVGLGIAQNPFLKAEFAGAVDLKNNRFEGNVFGKSGSDLNARDLVYSTNGTGNCFQGNVGMATTIPADPSFFPGCPFADKNPANDEGLVAFAGWATGKTPTYLENWVAKPHAAGAGGIVPIDGTWKDGKNYGPATL